MNVLITGGKGQLGAALVEVCNDQHDVFALAKNDLDITDANAVIETVKQMNPHVIIHAAAFTHVENAEDDPVTAFRVNAYGTRNIAVAAQKVGAKLVYISTDYVFDGRKKAPYHEIDLPNPLNVYGASKRLGEQFVEMLCQRFFILRTAWLYGRGKQNFIYKLLQRLQNERKIYVVNDEFGSPTYTRDLALFIKNLIHTDLYGLYHVTNAGSVSRFTFAQTVMEMLGIDDVELIAIKTKDLSLKTKRPSFSALESIAIPCSGLCPLRDWQSALYDFLKHDLPSNFSMREGKSND